MFTHWESSEWISAVVLLSFIWIAYIACTFIYRFHLSPSSSRYFAIEHEYVLPTSLLRQIRNEFICDMTVGLHESDHLSRDAKNSSLAMLSSHVESMPNGHEKGVYYALDLGGTKLLVSRIEFFGDNTLDPAILFHKETIPEKYKKCDKQSILFDYLSLTLKKVLIENGDHDQHVSVGFTFSFPVHQLSSNIGVLKEWRKGFDIPGVVGQNVVSLMHEAFDRNHINATVECMLHDAVGTLLSCAYYNENMRIGLIIATGTNAAYIEPNRYSPHNIINTEWGSFISKSLTAKLTSIDMEMSHDLSARDGMRKYGENQFITKMISGKFLGELVRRLIVKVYREDTRWNRCSLLNDEWSLGTEVLSDILSLYHDEHFTHILDIFSTRFKQNELNESDAVIIAKICRLIVNRSADLAATLLLASAEKTGLYICDENDSFELNKQYKGKYKSIGVAVDGSVYRFVPRYKERMVETMTNIAGSEIAGKIEMICTKDGGGSHTGAALCVASQKNIKY